MKDKKAETNQMRVWEREKNVCSKIVQKRLMFLIEHFKVSTHAEFVFQCFVLGCVFICLHTKSDGCLAISISIAPPVIWICFDLFFCS